MPDDILLCGERNTQTAVTVGDYKRWCNEPDEGWSRKPDFIRRRLRERYIAPVEALDTSAELRKKKHGFYVMAVSCLLIETLVSFYRGWETTERRSKTKGKSNKAFKLFFRVEPRFGQFRDKPFYKNVRCGILHQGETTGGWIIKRSGPLYDGLKTINATKFHRELAHAVDEYAARLERNEGQLRLHFEKKMEAVIENCE